MTEPVFSYIPNGLTILWDFRRKQIRGKAMIFVISLKAVVLNLGGRKGFHAPPPQGMCGSVGRRFFIVTMGGGRACYWLLVDPRDAGKYSANVQDGTIPATKDDLTPEVYTIEKS